MPKVLKPVKKTVTPTDAPEIESGIEIPPRTRKGGAKYPFADMEVGHSFFVEADEENMVRIKGRLNNAASAAKKKLEGYSFSVREVEGGVRVWRTE